MRGDVSNLGRSEGRAYAILGEGGLAMHRGIEQLNRNVGMNANEPGRMLCINQVAAYFNHLGFHDRPRFAVASATETGRLMFASREGTRFCILKDSCANRTHRQSVKA